jgi:acyl-CoA synthetase (AMP-forming)/AMP-acid ligase II
MTDRATDLTWSAMLAAWAGRTDPAVITPEATWSGAELVGRAAGAARRLRAMTRCPAAVPALFTSTPAAMAYVIGGAACGRPIAPLGPRLTARELAPCVSSLGADVLLTEAEFLPLALALQDEHGVHPVLVDAPACAPDRLAFDAMGGEPAFVLHTSGTTGSPKGVAYRQGVLARRTAVNAALCNLEPGCVYATASPFHHISGFGNYAVALAAGAAVVPLARFTVEAWRSLADLGVTNALAVPTVLEILLEAGALPLPDLRTLQYGGAPIHPETLQRVLAVAPDLDLVNIFGQTEGSPITCLTPDDHRRIAKEGRTDLLQSAGRAAPGVELRIDAPDAAGVGEVLARAEHFFVADDGGWLHTGDLGRLDGEGYLFLVGRRGDKIIRGGENIYPIEVEQVLERHPAIAEAAVVGVADQRWGEVVRAVLVPVDPADPPAIDDVRAFARQALAGFKVPTEWVIAEALPRNAAGKLLRRSLQ